MDSSTLQQIRESLTIRRSLQLDLFRALLHVCESVQALASTTFKDSKTETDANEFGQSLMKFASSQMDNRDNDDALKELESSALRILRVLIISKKKGDDDKEDNDKEDNKRDDKEDNKNEDLQRDGDDEEEHGEIQFFQVLMSHILSHRCPGDGEDKPGDGENKPVDKPYDGKDKQGCGCEEEA